VVKADPDKKSRVSIFKTFVDRQWIRLPKIIEKWRKKTLFPNLFQNMLNLRRFIERKVERG